MTEVKQVYYMAPSYEIDRPQIGETGYFNEWDELERDFPHNVDCIPCQELVSFNVRADDALEWDWYGQVGMWGMWSQRAKDLLWPYADGCLRCFQTSLNGAPYYILRVDEELALDCLDRDRSELKYFPKNPNDIMDIKRYAFYRERLHDPMIFHVPERPEILGTQSIKQIVEEAGLKGFRFEDVEHLHR